MEVPLHGRAHDQDLDALLQVFHEGLRGLAVGHVPDPDALRSLTSLCLAGLQRRQAEALSLRRRGYHWPLSGQRAALALRHRLVEVELSLGQGLLRLDAAVASALETLGVLLEQEDFAPALDLISWCAAVHHRLALLPALEAAGALCRARRFREAQAALALPRAGASAGSLPCAVGRLVEDFSAACALAAADPLAAPEYLTAPPPCRLELGLKPGLGARCLAAGADSELFVGAFSDDLKQGMLLRWDSQAGCGTVLVEDVVVSGLFYDTATGSLLLTALRSAICPRPHVAWLDSQGRPLWFLELPDQVEEAPPWLPSFAAVAKGGIFVRDAKSKALLQTGLDGTGGWRVHRSPLFAASVCFSVVNDRVLVHFLNGTDMLEFDPATGALAPTLETWPGHVYRVVQEPFTGQILALSSLWLFSSPLPVRAQATVLHRMSPEGRAELLGVRVGKNCSDLAFQRGENGFSAYVAEFGTVWQYVVQGGA